jgi:autotransporter-associated beta strand protein
VTAGTGLTKAGAGTLILTGANTYSGGTTLTAGAVLVGVDTAGSLGSITSSAIGTGGLTFNGGTISSDSTTARTLYNVLTFTGNATIGYSSNTGAITFGAAGDLGSSTRTITVNTSTSAQFDGILSSVTAGTGLTKAGAGTLILTGANTYTGITTISAGTLTNGAAGVINDSSAVQIANSATWNLAGYSETVYSIADVSGQTTGAITLGSGTLTIKNTGGTSTT